LTALTALQVGSVLSYLIAIVLPALDAVLPMVPSETVVIALGVATSGSTDPRIALLVVCSALGAFLGDNLAYLVGRRFGPWAERMFFKGAKGAERRAWAERSLERFGMPLIIVCRFVPGGRTAVTLCCGTVGYNRRRFVIATAIAGSIWAAYSFFLGRLGGHAFADKPWAGLLVALGVTVFISGLIEAARRIIAIRRRARRARLRLDVDGVDHDVAQVGVQYGVEGATAGDEAQLRIGHRAVDDSGRKRVLGVQAHGGDPEHHERAVGPADVDTIPRSQRVKQVEDGRAGDAVDVSRDDRRASLAWPGA
jgi:membrane-associated protein